MVPVWSHSGRGGGGACGTSPLPPRRRRGHAAVIALASAQVAASRRPLLRVCCSGVAASRRPRNERRRRPSAPSRRDAVAGSSFAPSGHGCDWLRVRLHAPAATSARPRRARLCCSASITHGPVDGLLRPGDGPICPPLDPEVARAWSAWQLRSAEEILALRMRRATRCVTNRWPLHGQPWARLARALAGTFRSGGIALPLTGRLAARWSERGPIAAIDRPGAYASSTLSFWFERSSRLTSTTRRSLATSARRNFGGAAAGESIEPRPLVLLPSARLDCKASSSGRSLFLLVNEQK